MGGGATSRPLRSLSLLRDLTRLLLRPGLGLRERRRRLVILVSLFSEQRRQPGERGDGRKFLDGARSVRRLNSFGVVSSSWSMAVATLPPLFVVQTIIIYCVEYSRALYTRENKKMQCTMDLRRNFQL